MQAKLHANLANIFQQLNARATRAYALWSYLRSTGVRWVDKEEAIKLAMDKTGRSRQTVLAWIKEGVEKGLFINGRKNRLSIVGKSNVFKKYLHGNKPGVVVLIDAELLLTSSLSLLRARLYGTLFVKKATFATRETLKSLTGRSKRTQLKYDRLNHQRKRYNFLTNRPEQSQTANTYFRAAMYFTPNPKKNVVRQNLYGRGNSHEWGSGNFPLGGCVPTLTGYGISSTVEKKVFFERMENGLEAAKRRFKKGLNDIVFVATAPEKMTRKVKKNVKANRYGFFTMVSGAMENER